MLTIWLIEDDPNTAAYWESATLERVVAKWRSFNDVRDAAMANGNPDFIIFDVGSIGLRETDRAYLKAFNSLRSRFEHTPIILVSGLPQLPLLISEELPDDDLIFPITDFNFYSETADKLIQLGAPARD